MGEARWSCLEEIPVGKRGKKKGGDGGRVQEGQKQSLRCTVKKLVEDEGVDVSNHTSEDLELSWQPERWKYSQEK